MFEGRKRISFALISHVCPSTNIVKSILVWWRETHFFVCVFCQGIATFTHQFTVMITNSYSIAILQVIVVRHIGFIHEGLPWWRGKTGKIWFQWKATVSDVSDFLAHNQQCPSHNFPFQYLCIPYFPFLENNFVIDIHQYLETITWQIVQFVIKAIDKDSGYQ